jgi:hypothetical protein
MITQRSRTLHALTATVLVVALAGCSLLSAGTPDPPATAGTSQSTAAGSGHDGSDKAAIKRAAIEGAAVEGTDPDSAEPSATGAPDGTDGSGAVEEDWALALAAAFEQRDPSVRPGAPQPLVGHLPEGSVLRDGAGVLRAELVSVLASPDQNSAVIVALEALAGAVELVNEGVSEPFATVATTTCSFCLHRLDTAAAIHDEGGTLPSPWVLDMSSEASIWELSGPEHLAIEFAGTDEGLIYYAADSEVPVMIDIPGTSDYQVEMLYDGGQWWVIEVYRLA